MGKNQHVTPHKDGGWQVKGENNLRATIRTETQAEAIERAREIARRQESELFIHGRNGRIREIHMVMIRFHQKDKIEIHIIKNGLKKL